MEKDERRDLKEKRLQSRLCSEVAEPPMPIAIPNSLQTAQ